MLTQHLQKLRHAVDCTESIPTEVQTPAECGRCRRWNAFHNKQSAPALFVVSWGTPACQRNLHETLKNKIHSANHNECAEFSSSFFIFFSSPFSPLARFSSPKALRLECWQQICYSVHQITSSRWWRIKESERENESRLILPNVGETQAVSKRVPPRSLICFLFLTVKEKKTNKKK